MWVSTIRRESTREKRAEFSRDKNEGAHRRGEGGEEPV